MKPSSKPADSITRKALQQVPCLNSSEALHRRATNGVPGNMLTVQLFLTYHAQEAAQVYRSVSLFLRLIWDGVYV